MVDGRTAGDVAMMPLLGLMGWGQFLLLVFVAVVVVLPWRPRPRMPDTPGREGWRTLAGNPAFANPRRPAFPKPVGGLGSDVLGGDGRRQDLCRGMRDSPVGLRPRGAEPTGTDTCSVWRGMPGRSG